LRKKMAVMQRENLKFAGGSPAAGDFLLPRQKKVTKEKGAPDSDSRSVEREGAQAAASNIVIRDAHAAAPAPQASLTVSRQPPVRCPLGGALCCSPKRAAAQLALRAQTVLAEFPRLGCAARQLSGDSNNSLSTPVERVAVRPSRNHHASDWSS